MARDLTHWHVTRLAPSQRRPARAVVILRGREIRSEGVLTRRLYHVAEQSTIVLPPAPVSDEALVAEMLRRSPFQWNIRGFPRVRRELARPWPATGQAPALAVDASDLRQVPAAHVPPAAPVLAPSLVNAPYEPHHYALWEVAGIIGASVLGAALSSYGIGAALWIGAVIYAFARDPQGAATLRGAIRWDRMRGPAKGWTIAGFVLVYLFAFFVYDVQILVDYVQVERRARLSAPLLRQRHIAQMEAELGMLPASDDPCPHCGKPLQTGAAFCQSCGRPVKEQPPVCARCGTTALPGSAYCPKCGVALTAV